MNALTKYSTRDVGCIRSSMKKWLKKILVFFMLQVIKDIEWFLIFEILKNNMFCRQTSVFAQKIGFNLTKIKFLFWFKKKGESYLYEDTIPNLEAKLSPKDFFKINRKYIIKHSAIKNIFKYSQNRLKIELQPSSNSKELILVSSKNTNAFKNWLDN